MKKLSRKEVLKLIIESLNEQEEENSTSKNNDSYKWGGNEGVEIPMENASDLMRAMFSWNDDLRSHYEGIIAGKEQADIDIIFINSLKSLFSYFYF